MDKTNNGMKKKNKKREEERERERERERENKKILMGPFSISVIN